MENHHLITNENIKKNSEKGFALTISIIILVVMTIMGATLVTISSTNIMPILIKIVISKHFMLLKVEFQLLKIGWLEI